ncbi:response regulator transcription factor [Streptomyces sp. GESEQ-35]|uniref:response regulator transcription factor n=1 Tax=Streptomyces sp. GESEQ-35 TaxID=2812657 RepID=UPI001B33E6E4|nr:helix-turn-helix transcriptional regulator [Streptomyces sp. GESEQ-35]
MGRPCVSDGPELDAPLPSSDVLDLLSTREIEVLSHLAEGHTYSSIARRMHLSPHTVDTYLRRIRGKAGDQQPGEPHDPCAPDHPA